MIKQRSNCVINITTGGAATMTVEERVKPAATFAPEVASLNMGSMNFGLYPMLERFKTFDQEWEKPYLESSRDRIFRNTLGDIEYILTTCAENGTRFEIECYDIGHLYTLAHFADRGLVKAPFFVQSVFGILGGIGTHPEDVAHMKRTADRLFGERLPLVGARRRPGATADRHAGDRARRQCPRRARGFAVDRQGQLAKSSAEQVAKVRQIIEEFGAEVASPDEARQILQLKGGDKVRF